MLALLIYSYTNGIFCSRRIERMSYRDLGVHFVAANLHPDHVIIATFRCTGRAAFEAAFAQVLLRVGTVSIDGTKIDADISKNARCAMTGPGNCVIMEQPPPNHQI